ncbi:MAG: serine/threonine protein kinase, partial [Myxococcota bacterium]|nr:serine/threonine protein kinase [Myxococcota bacterium]
MTESCLDGEVLARYLVEVRAGRPEAHVDAHLDACAECRQLVFALACSTFGTGSAGADRAEAPKQTLGRYRLEELLATGGMGMVFAAFDPALQRRVAIKVMRRSPTEEERLLLTREAQSLAQLSHPNIVSVFDVGEDAGEVFLAMELIHGRDLAAWRHERPRSWREVVAVFTTVGEALAAAHRAGIVHRDLKPANVLITDDGRVCLTDFGLATHAADREAAVLAGDTRVVGTPAYMAPEQLAGAAADVRSDIFSYCVTLFETLHDHRPRTGGSETAPGLRPGASDA